MVYRWIWNMFHEWDRNVLIFTSGKIFLKILSHKWHKSTFNVKSTGFSVYYIVFGFLTCFFPIFDTACNIWRDSTIACYFHTMELTLCLLIFSHCEKGQRRYHFYSMDKTRYFMYENVMIIDVSWVPLQYIL